MGGQSHDNKRLEEIGQADTTDSGPVWDGIPNAESIMQRLRQECRSHHMRSWPSVRCVEAEEVME